MTLRDYQWENCGRSDPEKHRPAGPPLAEGQVCGQCAKEYYEAAHARTQADAAAMRLLLTCSTGCGRPATCYGSYESDGVEGYCCDECCGHGYGNENGGCKPIGDAGRALAEHVTLWRELETATCERSPDALSEDQRSALERLAALDEKGRNDANG